MMNNRIPLHSHSSQRLTMIMAGGNPIPPVDLELGREAAPRELLGPAKVREAAEREMVVRALVRNRGNLARCAENLKISRPTLYELIEEPGILRR